MIEGQQMFIPIPLVRVRKGARERGREHGHGHGHDIFDAPITAKLEELRLLATNQGRSVRARMTPMRLMAPNCP